MELFWSPEIAQVAELVKNKLYFAVTFSAKHEYIRNTADAFYFSVDEEFLYLNYYNDFGPLNISCLYKFCMKLHSFLKWPQVKRIVHYTSSDPNKRTNAAFLIGCFCVIFLNMEPKIVYKKLLDSGGPFKPYQDASQGVALYTLQLIECLQGIHKAHVMNFFDFNDFNVAEYDLYDKLQNGDFNWLVPSKFLALIGPIDKEISPTGHSPSFYIKYFHTNNVKAVIRLNNKMYNAFDFSRVGIKHYDLFFPDGTFPPKHILVHFLHIAENTNGAIAVHCKAGLGRTGSLIGAYIIKHFQFTAKEAIAWIRICRPGSIIGQQQAWLEKIESWLWKEGRNHRRQVFGEADRLPHYKYGIYSKAWQFHRRHFLQSLQKRAAFENYHPETLLRNESKENMVKRSVDEGKTQGDRLNDMKKRQSYVRNYPYGAQTYKTLRVAPINRNMQNGIRLASMPTTAVAYPMRTNQKLNYYK